MIIRERTKDILLKPADAAKIFYEIMRSMDPHESEKEHFVCFGLDTRNRIQYVDIVSTGTLNYNLVHPRETFRLAVIRNCAAVLFLHNHPSGSLIPSDEDLSLAKRLVQAGKLLGIEALDHVIIGNLETASEETNFYSFKQKGAI